MDTDAGNRDWFANRETIFSAYAPNVETILSPPLKGGWASVSGRRRELILCRASTLVLRTNSVFADSGNISEWRENPCL